MIELTSKIRENIEKFSNRKKIEAIHNKYGNYTAYIVSCGSTINEYDKASFIHFFRDKLVIAVKQAFNKLGQADFHILNPIHLQPYNYENCQPITVMHTFHHNKCKVKEENYDIILPTVSHIPKNKKHPTSPEILNIAKTNNFKEWKIDNRIDRAPCCGIVNTICFYLSMHLGVDKIVTVGYDLAHNKHFDADTNKRKKITDYGIPKSLDEWDYYTAIDVVPRWRDYLNSEGVELYKAKTHFLNTPIDLPEIDLGIAPSKAMEKEKKDD